MKIAIIYLFLIISTTITGQSPNILWEQTYGGGQMDKAYSVFKDMSENLWITGEASSDALLFSIDSIGNQNWIRIFGGTTGLEQGSSIIQNYEGNLIFAGYASSNDGDVVGLHDRFDYWVVCVDTTGTLLWQKCLGGSGNDFGNSIIQTSDSCYIVFGHVESNDYDVTTYYGINDLWLAKINSSGTILWRRTYGGSEREIPGKILQTSDGGYIFCGSSQSFDHDVSNNYGGYDVWVVKINSTGGIVWEKNYGGSGIDGARDIIKANDGGYYLVGNTSSADQDITDPKGAGDILAMKIDSNGTLLWSRCLGGSFNEEGNSGCSTINGVEIVGYTTSNDSDIVGNHGMMDVAVFELDDSGILLWSKCLGGSNLEVGNSVITTNDGGSVIAGYTLSSDGDIGTPNAGNSQAWIVKLAPTPLSIVTPKQNSIELLSYNLDSKSINLKFNSSVSDIIEIQLYDIDGRLKFGQSEKISNGHNNFSYDIDIIPGVYILNVKGNILNLNRKIGFKQNY
ncbi:MAG: T9SS type A sorting domain-containing protein [Bacteroidota bacterium]